MARELKLVAVIAITMTGCQISTMDIDRAARITNPGEASHTALQLTVNTILNTDVTIADNALTDSSLLIIERNPPRSLQNLPVQGRILDVPMQFRLVVNGHDCILIDQRDQSRHVLQDTNCEPE